MAADGGSKATMSEGSAMEDPKRWSGDYDPFEDPDEKRQIFSTLDSF